MPNAAASSFFLPLKSRQRDIILDLDHTLINSLEIASCESCDTVIRAVLIEEYRDGSGEPELYHARIAGVELLIKLRPFCRSFIRKLVDSGARLHIYTKGARVYMETVLSLIDSDGSLIKGAKVSRNDEPAMQWGKELRVVREMLVGEKEFPCFTVLDDSPHLWREEEVLVVPAQRYEFAERFVRKSFSSGAHRYPVDYDDFLKTQGIQLLTQSSHKLLNRSSFASTKAELSPQSSEDHFLLNERKSPIPDKKKNLFRSLAGILGF